MRIEVGNLGITNIIVGYEKRVNNHGITNIIVGYEKRSW